MSDLLLIPVSDETPDQILALKHRIAQLLAARVVDAVYVADGLGAWHRDSSPDVSEINVVDTGSEGAEGGKGANVAVALRSMGPGDRDRILLLDADVEFFDLIRLRSLIEATAPDTPLVKADFTRSRDPSTVGPELRGGRVTDLVARPLLRFADDKLASLGQPLSGQLAIHGSAVGDLLFLSHYALEIGMLISASRLGNVVEVNVGTIRHRRRDDAYLAQTAQDVVDGFHLATNGATWSGSRIQVLSVR